MTVDLEPIFNNEGANIPFDFTLDLSALPHGGCCPLKDPLRIRGEIKNRAGIVTLKAQAEGVFTAPCDRCADPLSRALSLPLGHCLIESLSDEKDDDGEYIEVKDMRLDLDTLCTEDIILSLPGKFLCRDDCKGLCPQCGADLNNGVCGCEKPPDPRLESLRKLLE